MGQAACSAETVVMGSHLLLFEAVIVGTVAISLALLVRIVISEL
jgi:hypothetical protein